MSTVAVQKAGKNERLPVSVFEELGNRFDEIQQRAYELFEQRGRGDGRDVEDWLKAEEEVQGSATAVKVG